jgi:exodeoxyribonuclease VII small subunit
MTDPTGTAVPEGEDEGGPGLEGSLRRLEEILAKLESQDLELGAALELFQEGVEHIRKAEGLLAQVELQVEELLGNGGTADTQPFPGSGDAGAGE